MRPLMTQGTVYLAVGILLINKNSAVQICNLGREYLGKTEISSEYEYGQLEGKPKLSAEKALDGEYHNHSHGCAGSKVNEAIEEAWWQVTFKSPSKIFKINLVFRENYTRHDGYYVFITNQTVTADELTSLSPVYHDEESIPSQQNTIVFPGGRDGIQVFLYVNKSIPTDTNFAVIEPCEVEIYGCVDEESDTHNCTCPSEVADESFSKTLWNSTVIFEYGTFSLRCNDNYLSLMNVTQLENSQTNLMLAECDGKQQCSYETDSNMQGQSVNFYCYDRCINENYTNTLFKYNLDEDLQNCHDVREPFTAYLKSRVFECDERHVLTDGNLTLQCRENGTWSGEPPVCNVTCMEPVHENHSTILEYGHLLIYFEDENVTYKCRKNHRHVGGNLIRLCNRSGDWTGEKPVCKRCKCPCDRVKYQNFISDPQILEKRLDEMKKELEVHKEKLSKTVRAKTCAKDERTSSKRLGSVLGVGIIVSVLMFICCSDLPLLCRHIRYGP